MNAPTDTLGRVVRCAYAQPEEAVDAERAKRAAEDAGHRLQPVVPAYESRLTVAACGASSFDVLTARRSEVPHPVGDRAVENSDDETVGRAGRQYRCGALAPSCAPAMQDDGQRRQPSRDLSHNRVCSIAVEPSKPSRQPSS